MKVTNRETVFRGNYLKLVYNHYRTDNGEEGIWETVERTNVHGGGVVVIVALTRDNELILERNWRIPVEQSVIQLPAGLCDQATETEEDTARRELLEETGYLAGQMVQFMFAPMAPALTGTRGSHFLARDVEYVGHAHRDSAEEIEVIKVPLKKIGDFLLNLPKGTELDLRVPGILWIMEERHLI
jgi:ADP-ribose pyrophosphatase